MPKQNTGSNQYPEETELEMKNKWFGHVSRMLSHSKWQYYKDTTATKREHVRTFLMSVVSDSQRSEDHARSFLATKHAFPVDKQKWHQTSIYEIFDRHKSRTSESCVNVCDIKKDLGCEAVSSAAWKTLMLSPYMTFMPLMSESEYIYPFEVDYLSQPPLTDQKQLPSLTLSKVTIDGAVDNVVFCDVRDVIKGHVNLVDGFGKQRIMGGDDVRVWVKGGQSMKNKAVGHVTDLTNGSYRISFICLWPGEVQLNVAVAYPREYLRTVIHQIHIGVSWFFSARFKKEKIEEVTLCYSAPNIPGRPCLCNFTTTNQQSLYCGRPFDPRLSCDNWAETFNIDIPLPHNVTPEEYNLIKNIPKPIAERRIRHNITVLVTSSGKLPSLKPCNETSPKETWDLNNRPSGYWAASGAWESMICQSPKMTSGWVTSCLKNTSVWVFGDSNGFHLIKAVLDRTKTVYVQSGTWPYQFIEADEKNNITFKFTPLEYPLYSGKVWQKRLPYGGVAKQIDSIPSQGVQILVIHYYLHITPSHLKIVFLRLIAAKEAVVRLINRNPDVLVGIRGPHVSTFEHDFNHSVGGDNLGIYFLQMILDVFADLKHKVVFLDGWEMTVALENSQVHPVYKVAFEMMRTLLAFRCS